MQKKEKDERSPASKQSADRILQIMSQLRDPQNGCQWDLEQNFESLSKYVIEEAYEVAEAVADGNVDEIMEELGDLLLQVVFFSQIASEKNLFRFLDVVNAVSEKMIRRHPHIFSKNKEFKTAKEQKENWEIIKDLEKSEKNNINEKSLLSGVSKNLPSLIKSKKIQEKVSRAGFDWKDEGEVLEKVKEELAELSEAIKNSDRSNSEEELGDLLFTLVNLGRHMDIDCDTALRKANYKFSKRFNLLELQMGKENKELSKVNKLYMEKTWSKVKKLSYTKNDKPETTIDRS
jgi:MazG family protein